MSRLFWQLNWLIPPLRGTLFIPPLRGDLNGILKG